MIPRLLTRPSRGPSQAALRLLAPAPDGRALARMNMNEETIRISLRKLDLAGRDVAVHSSLGSFGHVTGGARTVIRTLLEVCGTVLMPTFCEIGRTNPPPEDRPAQNGWDYEGYHIDTTGITPFNPNTFNETSELVSNGVKLY